jgi:hypothetical protein
VVKLGEAFTGEPARKAQCLHISSLNLSNVLEPDSDEEMNANVKIEYP